MKDKLYKILVFKDKAEKDSFGEYVYLINESELGGCDIPQLMQVGTTLRKLKRLYPKQDFGGVELKIVKLQEIVTNNS